MGRWDDLKMDFLQTEQSILPKVWHWHIGVAQKH
jgi:hypothetical protein